MAGRIRSIKPEILADAITAGLSHEAFRLFIGAIVLADDWGNLPGDNGWLFGQIFYRRPLAGGERELEELLAGELLASKPDGGPGLIERYQVRRQVHLSVTGWFEHQKIDHPSAPRFPTPLEADDRALRRRFRNRASSRLPLTPRDLEYGGEKLRAFIARLSRDSRLRSGSGSGSGSDLDQRPREDARSAPPDSNTSNRNPDRNPDRNGAGSKRGGKPHPVNCACRECAPEMHDRASPATSVGESKTEESPVLARLRDMRKAGTAKEEPR